MLFFKTDLSLTHLQLIPYPYFQRIVFFVMTYRKTITYRVIVFFYNVSNNLVSGLSKRPLSIFQIRKAANDQSGEFFELATAFQLVQHAIDIVEIFADIFDKKNSSFEFIF